MTPLAYRSVPSFKDINVTKASLSYRCKEELHSDISEGRLGSQSTTDGCPCIANFLRCA